MCVCVSPVELMTSRVRQQQRQRQQQLLLMNLHLLANPGDSLLLQHTLDRLLRWLCPSLRIFHVSERASPFRSYTRLCPVTGNDTHCVVFIIRTSCYTVGLEGFQGVPCEEDLLIIIFMREQVMLTGISTIWTFGSRQRPPQTLHS